MIATISIMLIIGHFIMFSISKIHFYRLENIESTWQSGKNLAIFSELKNNIEKQPSPHIHSRNSSSELRLNDQGHNTVQGHMKDLDNHLMIGVMTTMRYLATRATAINRTWGQYVPGRIVFYVGASVGVTSSKLPKMLFTRL